MARTTPTARRTDARTLETILATRYGLDPETADPAVVVMAAEYLMWGAGVPAAKRQLALVNERRVAAGSGAVLPGQGHALSWEG